MWLQGAPPFPWQFHNFLKQVDLNRNIWICRIGCRKEMFSFSVTVTTVLYIQTAAKKVSPCNIKHNCFHCFNVFHFNTFELISQVSLQNGRPCNSDNGAGSAPTWQTSTWVSCALEWWRQMRFQTVARGSVCCLPAANAILVVLSLSPLLSSPLSSP